MIVSFQTKCPHVQFCYAFENVNLVGRDDEFLIVSFFLNSDSNSFVSFLPSSQKEKKNM